MAQDRFITPPLSLWLDLVRGLAALVVLIGHGVQSKLYTGPWPFSILLQHNAVTVFFVLSGLVIATSVDSRPGSLRDYAIARASRILPVALPAVLLSVILASISNEILPATDGKPPLRPMQTALATVFLSESFGPGWALNAPYWSLCYEVWFYALFGAWTYLRGKARLAWTAGLALVAGANILLLLPIWLVGVALARDPAAKVTDPVRGASFLIGGLIVFHLVSGMAPAVLDALMPHYPWNLGYALYAPTDLLLGLAVAACFIGLRPLVALVPDALVPFERPIRWLAGCSFSIYLFHAPVLHLLYSAGLGAGENFAGFLMIMVVIIALCAALAQVTEHRRPAVQAWLERVVPRGRSLPAAA